MPVFFSDFQVMLHKKNGLLLDVLSEIYANNYHFNDSHYAILIVRKQYPTGNLLLSIKQDDQSDWDDQDDWDNQGDYGDWLGFQG